MLDVEFGRNFTGAAMGRIAEARVRRVVRGAYDGRTVRVFLLSSTCSDPFMFGTSGLIIGSVREGVEVERLPTWRVTIVEGRVGVASESEIQEFRRGAEGHWVDPRSESIGARRERTAQIN